MLWYTGLLGCALALIGLIEKVIVWVYYFWPFIALVVLGMERSSRFPILDVKELKKQRRAERFGSIVAVAGVLTLLLSQLDIAGRFSALWGDLNTPTGLFWYSVNALIAVKCCFDCRRHERILEVITL